MSRKTLTGTAQFTAKAVNKELQMEIYDQIGQDWFGEGITAQTVSDALKEAHDSVTLRINSPGGEAFTGVAIYNLLKSHGKPVNVIVDGLAASAASIVAMAGDTITMGKGSMLMIHPAMAMAGGDAKAMREMADTLDKVTENMADIYVARSSQPKDQVVAWMNAETWMNPQEACDRGFATAQTENQAAAMATFDISMYKNAPKPAETTETQPETPVITAENTPVVEEEDYTIDILRKRLSMQRQG